MKTETKHDLLDALDATFFRPITADGEYHPGEADVIRGMYPELGGHVTLERVLACVAKYGDRRCTDGATASRRQKEAASRLTAIQRADDGVYTGAVARGHGLPAYPAIA